MPTSSQNTNTMAILPATTSPNMLKQNSERYWKKRGNRPRRTSGPPSDPRTRGSVTSPSSSCMYPMEYTWMQVEISVTMTNMPSVRASI